MIKVSLLALLLFVVSGVASAQTTEINPSANDDMIRAKLTNELNLQVIAINKTSAAGIKEVQTHAGIFYVTNDGSHLFRGEIFELADQVTNMTAMRLAELRVKGIEKLTQEAISFKANEEKYVVTAFINLPCSY